MDGQSRRGDRGSGNGVGGVKVTSTMADTDLEKSLKVTHYLYLVKLVKRKG
jgi:hypothetical protein